jgi:glycerophosphoryl diester phosphodiesterase
MKIIGHRGAAGTIPENTLEGFAAAFNMGADAVELDIVPTRDGKLLVRHEGALEFTTNVVDLPEFQNRCVVKEDGTCSWRVETFTRDEWRALHARERYPELRSISAAQDDLYLVPSLSDVFNDSRFVGKSFVVELKHAKYYREQGLDMVELLEECMMGAAFPHGIDVSLESFDWDTCLRLAEGYPELNVVFPIDAPHWDVRRGERNEREAVRAFVDELQTAGLSRVAGSFDLLFESARTAALYRPTLFLEQIRDAGITVYGFTASDDLHKPSGLSPGEYWRLIAGCGLDGIFTDQPDKLRLALDPL